MQTEIKFQGNNCIFCCIFSYHHFSERKWLPAWPALLIKNIDPYSGLPWKIDQNSSEKKKKKIWLISFFLAFNQYSID